MFFAIIFLNIFVGGTTVCAQTFQIGDTFSGSASYYHKKFQGRKTASGEIFKNDEFTCAHKKFPFGTMIEITNIANGRKVITRVNDRGPFSGKRILDMSHAAAKELRMFQGGIIKIKARIVGFDGVVNVSDMPTVSEETVNILTQEPDILEEKPIKPKKRN